MVRELQDPIHRPSSASGTARFAEAVGWRERERSCRQHAAGAGRARDLVHCRRVKQEPPPAVHRRLRERCPSRKRRYGEGRRIFLMAPLHHHYEAKEIHESKIVIRFWIVTAILVILALLTLLCACAKKCYFLHFFAYNFSIPKDFEKALTKNTEEAFNEYLNNYQLLIYLEF